MNKTLKGAAMTLALNLGALSFGALAGVALVAPPVMAAVAPVGPTVKIDNFVFGPEALVVTVGTTVTWINQDDIPHNIVANDKTFKSKVLDTDERFSFTFTKPGEYGYFCGLHPHMTGKVIVKAG